MKYKTLLLFAIIVSASWYTKSKTSELQDLGIINISGSSIKTRFNIPEGFSRILQDSSSFGYYLQKLPLKKQGNKVLYYDKTTKDKENVYISVVAMDIDPVDLQQCADAVMRLRGEYLYKAKKYEQIHFNYISDGKPRYFKAFAKGNYSYQNFRKYMREVFSYANTASLLGELTPVSNFKDMKVGDVLIQKGHPYGHAVIVVDMAENTKTKQKMYMLAQSYMPAQETQILLNPNSTLSSPWYKLEEGVIQTPEWTFNSKDLRRFK